VRVRVGVASNMASAAATIAQIGSSKITVTAAFGAVSHATTVTLNVQYRRPLGRARKVKHCEVRADNDR
jgi:hypothetical protein